MMKVELIFQNFENMDGPADAGSSYDETAQRVDILGTLRELRIRDGDIDFVLCIDAHSDMTLTTYNGRYYTCLPQNFTMRRE